MVSTAREGNQLMVDREANISKNALTVLEKRQVKEE